MSIVAIVGRPNVGKSTLFNRLIGERKAIIHDSSGTTRDRHYGKTDWNGVEFSVIDTGGYVNNSDDIFEEEICKQVKLAIDEADAIIMVVDHHTGPIDLDYEITNLLRRTKKPVFLVVNKVDSSRDMLYTAEFYALGLGELYPISAVNGSGTGDLLDKVVAVLPVAEELSEDEESVPKYTIIGRPNVGKSSFLNALVEEERNIVTPLAGTTRDTIKTRYNKYGQDFFLIDTAGLRKRAKEKEDIEFYSTMRSVRAIENSDVCFLVLDATRGIEAQDVTIFNLIQKNHKGVVILVNKWDLVEKDTHSVKFVTDAIHERIAPFVDVPIVFISALTKQRVYKALEEAKHVYENRLRKIPTRKLNDVMLPEIEAFGPPTYKGKMINIKFVQQLPTHAPTFAFYANHPQYIKEQYKRYVENKMRSHFDFTGVPIQIFFREK